MSLSSPATRRRSRLLVTSAAWVCVAVALGCAITVACSSSDDASPVADAAVPGDGAPGARGSDGAAGDASSDAGAADAAVEPKIYVNTTGYLYRATPDYIGTVFSPDVALVHSFDGCGDTVLDVALDKTGRLFATTPSGLFAVDRTTARCTRIGGSLSSNYPSSLAFVAAGLVDADAETLVGYVGRSYVRVDTTTGEVRILGSIGLLPDGGGEGKTVGDLIAVGDRAFASVTGSGTTCHDCVAEIDPRTGAMTGAPLDTHVPSITGLAYWDGLIWMVSSNGQRISTVPGGSSLSAARRDFPPADGGIPFAGAGSATDAPIPAVIDAGAGPDGAATP